MSEQRVRAEAVDPQPAARRPTSLAVLVLGLIAAVLAGALVVQLVRDLARDAERRELACQVQELGGDPIGDVDCPPEQMTPAPSEPAAPVLPPERSAGATPGVGPRSPAAGSTAPPRPTSGPRPPATPGPQQPPAEPDEPGPVEPPPPASSPDVQVCTRLTGCTDLDLPLDTPLLRLMPTA